jgi:DNA-binding NarL/FixJ family response regulator
MRDELVGLFEAAGFATVAASTGHRAVELALSSHAAVVVLDVSLPGRSGYEVCRELREALGGSIGIVFLSGERTEAFDRVAGLLLGADDYVAKPFEPGELVARVRSVLRRASPTGSPVTSRLTRRELEVLRLLARGRAQGEIAAELVISPKTVGTHIEHILEKLGVRSRAQAVAVAYREDVLGARS